MADMKRGFKGIQPLIFLLIVWFTIFVVRLIPIGGNYPSVRLTTVAILFTWFAIFTFAWLFVRFFFSVKNFAGTNQSDESSLNRRIALLSAISAIGSLFLVIEFALLRGYGFSQSVAEIRILEVGAALEGRQGSALSGIGRLMMSATIVAWIFATKLSKPIRFRTRVFLYLSTAIVLYAQSAYEGGRFFLVALVLTVWFTKSGVKANKIKKRNNRLQFFAILIVALFSGFVFIQRFADDERILLIIYDGFVSDLNIALSSAVQDRLTGSQSSLWFVAMMLWVYVTHAITEFDALLDFQNLMYAYGSFQLPQFSQLFRIVFGLQESFNPLIHLPNVGVYVTALGAMYIDFSYFGLYFSALILGAVISRATSLDAAGCRSGLAYSAPIFMVVAIFLPVHSIITTVWPAIIFCWMSGSSRNGHQDYHLSVKQMPENN